MTGQIKLTYGVNISFLDIDPTGQIVLPFCLMKLTPKQKSQGKWQRTFNYKKVARTAWLTSNDRKLLNAILNCRHMQHKSQCGTDCETGWAKIPRDQLKKEAGIGQDKLKKTVERLVALEVLKRESEGKHAGRDGATRYRIVSLPPSDPGKKAAQGSQ